jgi:protein involved in polysaccharide export with SLBB domain
MPAERKDDYGRRQEDGVEVGTPGGWKLRANGQVVSTAIILAVAIGVEIWSINQAAERMLGQLMQNYAVLVKQQADIIVNQRVILDAVDINSYILTLDQVERRALKLDMPDALRKRVHGK